MFKKVVIFLSFIFLFSFLKTDVSALSSQSGDTIVGSSATGYYEKVGKGHSDTISKITFKIKAVTSYNVAVFGLKYCQYESCSGGTNGLYQFNNYGHYAIYPAECREDPSEPYDEPLTVSSSCPAGTDVTVVGTFDPPITLNSSKYYSVIMAGGASSSQFQPYGSGTGGSNVYYSTNGSTYTLNDLEHLYFVINDDTLLPIPSGSVSSQTISIMDNTYVINMEGDFDVTGPNYVAQITFQPACTTDDGHISLNDDSVVVMFEANNPRTSTEKITENLYYGEDYSTTSSLYSLHDVKLPFVAGQNCTYIATVSITDYTDPFNPIPIKLDNEGDPYVTVMGEFTPTGNTPSMPLIDYEPNSAFCDTFDLSCYVSYGLTQIKNFFMDLYKKIFLNDYNIFDDAVPEVYDGLVATLQTKKPFAYMYNVFDLNLHSDLLSDGIPDMNVSFGNSYGIEDITVNFPSSFDAVLNSIRNIILIILGTIEIFYFVNLARRVRG